MHSTGRNRHYLEAQQLTHAELYPAAAGLVYDANEVDYEITRKGGPERGSVVSQKSLAPFIMKNHLLTYSACGCWPATGSSTT
jgi:hypothetical protein